MRMQCPVGCRGTPPEGPPDQDKEGLVDRDPPGLCLWACLSVVPLCLKRLGVRGVCLRSLGAADRLMVPLAGGGCLESWFSSEKGLPCAPMSQTHSCMERLQYSMWRGVPFLLNCTTV